MDFEIEEGRLLACLGNDADLVIPEGVKFIARDCIFSNAAAIKSIYLPQSFLGFEKANKDDNYFIFNNETQTITKIRIKPPRAADADNRHVLAIFETDYSCFDIYGFIGVLKLPNLERFLVHQYNPIYSDLGGSLYCKDKSCLLSIPPKNVDEVVLPEKLSKINSGVALIEQYAKLKVICLARSLDEDMFEQLCLLPCKEMVLYAPNLNFYFEGVSNRKPRLKKDSLICCFPGSMLFFVGSIKSHLSNLNLFKPQGLSIISSKAPRGIHNFQEEVLRVWYAITSSSNCFNQLNCTLTFS